MSAAATPASATAATRFQLGGGLPVVVRELSGPPILSARLAIRGGSGADRPAQRGAHQLLAGLMTRGCGDLDAEALADLVEGAGAALRAEATEDSLVIALKCAAADAATLLPLLPEMVCRPSLAEDQFRLERQLNLQTLQRQREDPFQLAHDQLRQLLYGDGPYGHDPLGIEAELASLEAGTLPPLLAELGRQGAVLVLCGSVPDRLMALLDTPLTRGWQTGLPAPVQTQPWQPPGPRLAVMAQDTEQLVLLLGAGTVPLGDADAPALRLLQSHLGLGMSCRLFVVMREERGLAYDVGVHLPARLGASPFVMHLSTSAERAEEATGALLDEWQRICEQALDAAELTLALAKFRGQDAMGRQTRSQIAERLALILASGLPLDHVERSLQQAAALTAADLQRAAQRLLAAPCLSLVGPAAALDAAQRAWTRHPLCG
ncbi:MAG: pitrilysin family protein [Synechococcaceae cyanobacterium]|nr:pitrilysin family protein [Synechococcaceae cyanobacterium]